MNIIQKVNNREITPRHNNYQEVTVDAKGNGPVINFDGVHARTGGLAGLSPLKQTWLDNTQKGLSAAGWIPGWGAIADLGNAVISGGRSLYSLAKGDTEGAKKHGKNVLWNIGYAVPGLEYGVKGAKAGTKIYKNLRTTGNPIQSFRKNPIRSSAEAGLGGLVESQTDYSPGSGYDPSLMNMQDIKDIKQFFKEEGSNIKQNVKENFPLKKVPLKDNSTINLDSSFKGKNPLEGFKMNPTKGKGDKPNKSWQASDYQKYYDNMKKQKN